MGKPVLPDINTIIQAGINPKTGLPIKLGKKCNTKEDYKKFLRVRDQQDFCNRYIWYNLPGNISSQELERLLYYKGQLCAFYDKDLEEFYFLPYALDGQLDAYGRFRTIHPVPISSGGDEKSNKALATYLANKKLKVVYGVKLDPITEDDLFNSAVILRDYTNQLSQTVISRQIINEPIIDNMADNFAFMRTAGINATGISGVRVNDADQEESVNDANRAVENAALTGEPFVAMVAKMDFQQLTNGGVAKCDEYLMVIQSLDNLRLSGMGINSGGIFEKKTQVLQSEFDVNGGNVGLVLQDGLTNRQHFCNIFNSIFGTGIWCEIADSIAMTGRDGVYYDEDDNGEQSGIEQGEANYEDDSELQY